MKIPKEIVRQREIDVWALRQKGWTHERIADQIHVERTTVTKILKRLSLRYRGSLDEEVKQVQAEHIARLEYIAYEAMAAWERSKENSESVTTTTQPGKRGYGVQDITQTRIDGQTGDPRYLQMAAKALEDIRKITGANAPDEVIHDWRKHAEQNGVDAGAAGEAFEAMVRYFASRVAESDGAGRAAGGADAGDGSGQDQAEG